MERESTEIEVEVVEIDGLAPAVARSGPTQDSQGADPAGAGNWQQPWRVTLGRMGSLGWPLWIPVGILALVLLLTFGVAIALGLVLLRLVRLALRALFR